MFGESAPETPQQADTPPVAATPEGTTPPTDTPPVDVQTQTNAQLAQLSDDQLVEIIVDGKPVTMPWKEAKAGFSRHADYTRKTQELAREREAFAAEREPLAEAKQQLDALVTVFNNEELLKQVLSAKYPHLLQSQVDAAAAGITAAQQPTTDPDEIATVGQIEQRISNIRELIANEVQKAQQELRQEIGKATREVEDNLETAKLATQINSEIARIFEADPLIMRLIPNAEQLLRWNVQLMKPQTPEATLEAFRTVAAGWSEEIKAAIAEHNKTAVLNKQTLEQNNTVLPGGAPVTPQATDFRGKDGKVDWAKVTELAMQYGSK